MNELKTIKLDEVEYVRKDSIKSFTGVQNTAGLPYVCIRTYSAGVHFGYLKSTEDTPAGRVVVLLESKRIWRWSGAATLSQLAMEGTKKPNECKIPMAVDSIELINVIECTPVTEEAKKSIDAVKVWSE